MQFSLDVSLPLEVGSVDCRFNGVYTSRQGGNRMAFESGGYADKLGNRFEGRWVVRQLLLLLNEQIRSVTLESVGDDEAGVDLWIERTDGVREAQQCKAENGTKPHWTLADLKRRGVLDYLRTQLERDPRHVYTLVSGSPAPQLRDLSRSACDSTGNAESFYHEQILTGGRERQTAFSEWCRCLGLQESVAYDRDIAFKLLGRCGFHSFVDTRESRLELEFMARQAVMGEPVAVIALLADFAASNLRKPISVTDVARLLRASGHEPRRLFADDRITPRLYELQNDFKESIQPHLAGNRLLPRPEADEVLKLIESDSLPDAIVLHGPAGYGKSGVLYQLTLELQKRGTQYLALRLDRKVPRGSARQFGEDLGLPESPVNCLAAVSRQNHSVLIVDQLDALRWTSSHSAEGLDVCKGVLREILALRLLGNRVSVVLCCRTFDLEHDPQIRDWLKSSQGFVVEKVKVRELAEDRVRAFVESFDVNFERMTHRCQKLLRTVQNLAIWAELVQSEEQSPEFDSGTDLMRRFWQSRRREVEKAGLSASERDDLINRLVNYMESHATLSAPIGLIESYERLTTELQTLNVIHTANRMVSFCHQSYLDFLIATRVADQLSTGTDAVVEWLGSRSNQSLFRREQLRQLLFLLAEDHPERLLLTLDKLLSSDSVRFQMKQLTIEAIGQLKPTNGLVDFVVRLTDSEEWQIHVFHDVLRGNLEWITAFHNRGRLIEWLLSNDTNHVNLAFWLLASVAEFDSPLLSETLAITQRYEKQSLLREILHHSKAQSEADDVFAFRLQCIGESSDTGYVPWKKLADERPDRALQLVAVLLRKPLSSDGARRGNTRLEMDGSDDIKALKSAARSHAILAVQVLSPILVEVASRRIAEHRAWQDRDDSPVAVPYPHSRYSKVLMCLMTAATTALARNSPNKFRELSHQLSGVSSRMVQAMLVSGWTAMPISSADEAIKWLLADRRRLRCGLRIKRPRWCAAAKLIERMSPHCSDESFAALEQALLNYRDPDEKRLASSWLSDARRGNFRNQFGAGQRFLLPALDTRRRRAGTNGRIGVLIQKFADYPIGEFRSSRSLGGWVRSPLDVEASAHISDRQWLRIISNSELSSRNGPWRKAVFRPGVVIESSIETFSRDFGIAANRDPERFGKLVLSFPANAPSLYFVEVLRALQRTTPGNEVAKEQRELWQPASRDCVEQVLEHVTFPNDADTMRSYCWLVGSRKDIRPSERVVDQLIALTEHCHPELDSLVVGCDKLASEVGIGELEQNAINSVRSLTAIAIASLLYDRPELFARFRPALERLIYDEHPVVRTAMVQVSLSLWNIDRSTAIQWFEAVCASDLRLASGHYARKFFNYGFSMFAERLTPFVEAMCKSPVDEVAKTGAQEATARWLFFGLFNDLVQDSLTGSVPQRLGVASIVSQFVRDEKYCEQCWPILLKLCDDPSSEVRAQAGGAMHDERVLGTTAGLVSFQRFLLTQAFCDDPDSMIDALQDHPGSLIPFANLICDTVMKCIEIICDPHRKPDLRVSMIDRHLSSVLLRLYEQSSGADNVHIRDRCLDLFDQLLQHRVVSANTMLREIEK